MQTDIEAYAVYCPQLDDVVFSGINYDDCQWFIDCYRHSDDSDNLTFEIITLKAK